MKKILLRESQLKSILKYVIKEQNMNNICDEKSLKDINISMTGTFKGSEMDVKKRLQTENFKITSVYGVVNLNGKDFDNKTALSVTLAPLTKIKLCGTNYITVSCKSFKQAKIFIENNKLMFDPQYA